MVGDVGIRAKLDYTAHGDAINAAARFEAANKDLGSTICVGPQTASRCDQASLRPIGTILVRGRDDPLSVFEPWPTNTSAFWRENYLQAFAVIESNPRRAFDLFEDLATVCPDDPVLFRLMERLAPSCGLASRMQEELTPTRGNNM